MALVAARKCVDYSFDVHIPERQLLHGAMNQTAQILLDHGHEGLIVCDDDCFMPYDAIPRLLAHADAGEAIVAGVGIMRNWPHTTTVGKWLEEGYTLLRRADGEMEWKGFTWYDDLRRLPVGLAEVDFCGMPIMWIARRVFERIPPPWFGTNINGGECTHDVYFATKASEAGFKVKVDTTLRCGHLTAGRVVDFDNRAEIRGAEIALRAMRERPNGGAVEYLEGLAKELTDGQATQPV